MAMLNKYLFLLLILSGISESWAQRFHDYPLTVTVFNEGVSFPYSQLLTRPIHPGITLETQHINNPESRGSWGWNVSIGYYFHRHFANGLFAQGHLLYRYQTQPGIYLQGQVGTGYLHVFRAAPEYRLQKGHYVKSFDWGSGRIMPSIGLELGYRFTKEVTSPRMFARYETWIQYPFSPGFIPLLSHTNLHLGYSYYPFKQEKK